MIPCSNIKSILLSDMRKKEKCPNYCENNSPGFCYLETLILAQALTGGSKDPNTRNVEAGPYWDESTWNNFIKACKNQRKGCNHQSSFDQAVRSATPKFTKFK